LKNIENMINMLKDEPKRAKEDHKQFKIILEGEIRIILNSTSNKDGQKRFPLTGTTEEVSSDLQRIKEKMDIDHIVFNFNTTPSEEKEKEKKRRGGGIIDEEKKINIEETIKTAKQLSKFIK
jgi:hypothetical protein